MKWQIVSIIICVCFFKAQALKCSCTHNDCVTERPLNCSHQCYKQHWVSYENGRKHEANNSGCLQSGSVCLGYSVNLGHSKFTVSVECCDSDFCNRGPILPAVDLRPNGKRCHFCIGENCLGIVYCEGTEDHCIIATNSFNGQQLKEKGCSSKSYCDFVNSQSLHLTGVAITNRSRTSQLSVKCCEGDLCNSAEKVTLSFMMIFLLFFSLLQ